MRLDINAAPLVLVCPWMVGGPTSFLFANIASFATVRAAGGVVPRFLPGSRGVIDITSLSWTVWRSGSRAVGVVIGKISPVSEVNVVRRLISQVCIVVFVVHSHLQ